MKIIIVLLSLLLIAVLIVGASLLAKKSSRKTDISQVLAELLPGINCKQCGRKNCAKFAKDLSFGKTVLDYCPYIEKKNYKKAKKVIDGIRKIKFDKVALVKCKGGIDCQNKFKYIGDNTCATKNLLHSGDKFCPFACLGCGDCVNACPYDAIHISEKGCAVIDKTKCAGCGECVKACPNKLITLVPSEQFVYLICNNSSKNSVITRNCTVSCTHCGACVSTCPTKAITMVGGIPKIDNKKCVKCGKCVSACPNHVISRI